MPETIPTHKILGRELRLLKVLGSGSYGEVHLAEPVKGVRRGTFRYTSLVAVKVMHRHLCMPGQAAALLKESRTMQKLDHPCIVRYLGLWVEGGKGARLGAYCLAMGYCDGGDIDHLMAEGRKKKAYLPQDLLLRLMTCVLAGLNYSHSHRVIHRDIKPANVFLTRTITSIHNTSGNKEGTDANAASAGDNVNYALLGDFGLVRPLDATMQMAKTRVGTPCYCSPEIVNGLRYSGKTDVFSAGVMFYELMTHESPFWRKNYTTVQCFHQIIKHDPIPRLRELCKGRYTESVVNVVCACLAKNETQRPTAFGALTNFTTRFQRCLKTLNLSLYSDKDVARADSTDIKGDAEAEEEEVAEESLQKVAVVAPRAAAAVAVAAVAVAAPPSTPPAAATSAATIEDSSRGKKQPKGETASLAELRTRRLVDTLEALFATPYDDDLRAAVRDSDQVYALVKVLLLTRGGRRVDEQQSFAPDSSQYGDRTRELDGDLYSVLLSVLVGIDPVNRDMVLEMFAHACQDALHSI